MTVFVYLLLAQEKFHTQQKYYAIILQILNFAHLEATAPIHMSCRFALHAFTAAKDSGNLVDVPWVVSLVWLRELLPHRLA